MTLRQITLSPSLVEQLRQRRSLWRQLVQLARNIAPPEKQELRARYWFKCIHGEWPCQSWRFAETTGEQPSETVIGAVRALQIAWHRSKRERTTLH